MTNIDVIENKISAVKKYLTILEDYKKYSKKDLVSNIIVQGAVERFLYLVCQASIDLADAIVAYKKFRKPTALRESFDILQEEKVIPIDLAEKLVDMVGFRNVIAHDYAKVDYDVVYDVLQNQLQDILEFIEIIENKK